MVKPSSLFFLLIPLLAFSQDQSQYPDTIIDSYNSKTKTHDAFYGGKKGSSRQITVAVESLLSQNDFFVSLPKGSFVIVGFTNNYLIDAPNQNDIFIEEVGGAGEYANVFVSEDNIDYTLLAVAGNGELNEFDLASIKYKKQVKYIKIVGLDSKGAIPGFDLGNVYGLPGASKPKPEEAVVLENVLFETSKSVLLETSFVSLDKLAGQLQSDKSVRIEIRGHTDNVGNETKNQVLSEERAKTVLEYLLSKGIEASRLSSKGFGSSQSLASNENEEGRAKNRRVEFLKVE